MLKLQIALGSFAIIGDNIVLRKDYITPVRGLGITLLCPTNSRVQILGQDADIANSIESGDFSAHQFELANTPEAHCRILLADGNIAKIYSTDSARKFGFETPREKLRIDREDPANIDSSILAPHLIALIHRICEIPPLAQVIA